MSAVKDQAFTFLIRVKTEQISTVQDNVDFFRQDAKLDELLRSEGNARTSLTGLDDQEPEQIEAHRARAKARD